MRAESGKGSVRTPGPIMIKRMMWIPSGAARWPYHRRGSVADLTTRSLLSRRASRMGTASPTAACRMYRGRARPACHGGRGCWAGGQKSSYNARHAGVAQLVERRLPKPEVASSRLVARSTFHHRRHHRVGGHGVQAHGNHLQGPSRRHPGRFPVAAARAFQRQAPISSPPVFLATPACSAASRVAAVVCGLFLLPVSLLPVSTRQHRQDLHHFGSLCGIRITSRARAGS